MHFGKGLSRREEPMPVQHNIGFRQPGVCDGVVRVYPRRLLEIVDALSHTLFAPLVPEIPALQVSLMGFGTDRPSASQRTLFWVSHLDLNLLSDVTRHFVL